MHVTAFCFFFLCSIKGRVQNRRIKCFHCVFGLFSKHFRSFIIAAILWFFVAALYALLLQRFLVSFRCTFGLIYRCFFGPLSLHFFGMFLLHFRSVFAAFSVCYCSMFWPFVAAFYASLLQRFSVIYRCTFCLICCCIVVSYRSVFATFLVCKCLWYSNI